MSLFSLFKANDSKRYEKFFSYFNERGFGTEPPILTIFSFLPPKDRVIILEHLSEKNPSNKEVINKLSMALLKNGDKAKAKKILLKAKSNAVLNDFEYENLQSKIETLANYNSSLGSSIDYNDTLNLLRSNLDNNVSNTYSRFIQIMHEYCNIRLKQNPELVKTVYEKVVIEISNRFKNRKIGLLNLIALQVGQKPSIPVFVYGILTSVELKNKKTIVLKLNDGLVKCEPMRMRKQVSEYELHLNEIEKFEINPIENSIFIKDSQLAECTIGTVE